MKLFIIHGWTYSLDAWSGVLERLQTAGHEPVMLKVPGLTTTTDHPWSIEDFVSWLHEQLEGEESPIVVAHSNGGRIALNYDIVHPGHIKKLILIDSAGVARRGSGISLKRRLGKVISRLLSPLIRGRLRTLVYRLIGAGDYGRAEPHMRETMKHMLASDENLQIELATVPTDIIWGSADRSTPVEDAHEFKKRLPKSGRLEIIEHGTHSPHKTHPDLVAEMIAEMVGKN